MKRVGALLVSIMLVGVAIAPSASAETLQVNGGKLQVSAQVNPVHSIVVDHNGVIQQIASNTNGTASLKVFLNDYNQESQLSPEIQTQYDRILPNGTAFIGVVYDRDSVPPLLAPTKSSNANGITIEDLLNADIAL